MRPSFLQRVVLSNYKSIAACDVALGALTFLVGPNGSGKSNFLDALRFVSDSLQTSLDHALRERGGVAEVRRRSTGHPTHFGCRLEFQLDRNRRGYFAFRIGAAVKGRFEVQSERCEVKDYSTLEHHHYRVVNGRVEETSLTVAPAAAADRLYLVHASGLKEFRPVYEKLARIGVYNLNPDRIRDLQQPDAGTLLNREGGNLASVLERLSTQAPGVMERIEQYLERVVPGVLGFAHKAIGPKETIEFRQQVAGSKDSWKFLANNMSDGTLRALGLLTAIFQTAEKEEEQVPVVGVEEPETALHPAAAGLLLDALTEASESKQIIVTSHSPELLDDSSLDLTSLRLVTASKGKTLIAPPDAATISALKDQLFTAGELLRKDQLLSDDSAVQSLEDPQGSLFAELEAVGS